VFRKTWAEKIIQYLNNEIKWKYENTFKFKADITLTLDDKVSSSLDECLLMKILAALLDLIYLMIWNQLSKMFK
jgi:hypothetical protein